MFTTETRLVTIQLMNGHSILKQRQTLSTSKNRKAALRANKRPSDLKVTYRNVTNFSIESFASTEHQYVCIYIYIASKVKFVKEEMSSASCQILGLKRCI